MRSGKKNDPVYKIVATESQKARDGQALEVLGIWHPRENKLNIEKQKIDKWLSNGAVLTEAVRKLLKK